MDSPAVPKDHRSGFVGLIGRPNVGKSTLLNAFLKQNVVAVSFRPQTTRRRQLGILTLPNAQVIFVDTPGFHQPHHQLGERMNTYAQAVLDDVDIVLAIFDISQPPQPEDYLVIEKIRELGPSKTLFIALNKVDLLFDDQRTHRQEHFQSLMPNAEGIVISAAGGENRDQLLKDLIEKLPLGPRYYPEEDITDFNERQIAEDLIRAAAMQSLREEVPYVIDVRVDEYLERGQHGAYISATIFVERQSQKGILIGKGGKMMRKIGTHARREIENMSGRRVYLDLKVKVLKGWRNDSAALARFGYPNITTQQST
ncbi:MAG: GTPase Era [Chloroflexi bacterium]|nr:GTPase Era [Chloroflexota bacterium]